MLALALHITRNIAKNILIDYHCNPGHSSQHNARVNFKIEEPVGGRVIREPRNESAPVKDVDQVVDELKL